MDNPEGTPGLDLLREYLESESAMGLDVSVGNLAWLIATGADAEGLKWNRRDLTEINRVLAVHGLPPHVEPESLPKFEYRYRTHGMP